MRSAYAANWLVMLALACPAITACSPTSSGPEVLHSAAAFAAEPYPVRLVDRSRYPADMKPAVLNRAMGEKPGTIIVDTKAKRLYLVESESQVRRYGIAVGKSGAAWQGTARIGRKAEWPAWYPTDDMHAQTPGLPRRIEPGSANPLGARAMYLYQGGQDTLYRIHGTTEPWTIGTEASSGCIRMLNEDVIDLYARANVGATVIVR